MHNPLYGDTEYWIRDRYHNSIIDFPNSGSWQIVQKLSERSVNNVPRNYRNGGKGVAQATSVFMCTNADASAQTAILKLHLQ